MSDFTKNTVEQIPGRIREILIGRRLIEPGDRVMAAVSGGADSTALLVILNHLKKDMSFDLSVCHLNHQIRGELADADEQFVKELCEKLHVQLYLERRDVPAIRERAGGSLEEVARRVRYEFFETAACRLNANKIALAHHRDDQCETVVFNLCRGSGIHGLRGMPMRRILCDRVELIRPMLTLSKSELEEYLQAHRMAWCRDHTNEELRASRNVIRHTVLPAMRAVHPAVQEHLLDLAEQAGQIEALLGERVRQILSASRREGETICIEQWRIRTLPELLAGEVVRAMLMEIGAGLSDFGSRHFRYIAGLSGRMDLPAGMVARTEHGWLMIGPRATREVQYELSLRVMDYDALIFKNFCRTKSRFQEMVDADKVCGSPVLRLGREGERFWPLGAPGHKKVGDFLTDVKAGWSARPATVVADEKGIIWLIGWRIDDRVKVTNETKRLLLLEVKEQHYKTGKEEGT